MVIEVYEQLSTELFKSNVPLIKSLKAPDIVDTSRDFVYNLNVNAIKEGILDLTFYIVHQKQDTGEELVTYVGVIKAFLLDIYDEESDKRELIEFVTFNLSECWNYVVHHQPNLKITLRKKADIEAFCDKMMASLKTLGFYKN